MTKTIDDYMNDPDIINEPMAMREIHAIRLQIHDEIEGMTPSEHTAYFHNRAAAYFNRDACYYFKGDKEKAIPDFEKVVQINPNHTEAKNILKELRGW